MLLIILLGVIAKLAVVSADCNIRTVNLYNTVWTNQAMTWYWLYHIPQNYNDNLDCPVTTYEPVTKDLGRIITSVYVKSTQTRHQISGTAHWNSDGLVDFQYSEPSTDIKCVSNESCIKNPTYSSLWSGKYHLVSVDPRRYGIFEYCCPHLNTICFYVAFRTPNPDEETLNDMKRDLKRNGLDFNRLVKWENKHC